MTATKLTPAMGAPLAPERAPDANGVERRVPAPLDRASRPVPERLVDGEGHPNLGAFRGAIRELNTRDLRAPFRRFAHPAFLQKRWNQFMVVSPRFSAGLGILDLGYVATCFCYVHDRDTNRLHEFMRMAPFGIGLTFRGTPLDGRVRFRMPRVRVRADHDCARGERRVELFSRGYRGALDLTLRIADDGHFPVPISSVQGLPPYGLVYSHRTGPLPVNGVAMIDGKSIPLVAGESFALFNWLWAIHPRDARWTWASGAGRSADGSRVVGFNLTRGSDGLGEPENFLWFDGEASPVGRVTIAMDLARKDGEWAVRSEDGRVRLTFAPDVVRMGKRDAVWSKVYFRQPIGRFSGTIVDADGGTVEIRDLAGFAGDHAVHW
jgi:hypothetical protein